MLWPQLRLAGGSRSLAQLVPPEVGIDLLASHATDPCGAGRGLRREHSEEEARGAMGGMDREGRVGGETIGKGIAERRRYARGEG